MPKVVDKPNHPAALLLSKRPPAGKPQGEQTFDHALQRAQPKRDHASKAHEPATPPGPQPIAEPSAEPIDAAVLDDQTIESDQPQADLESPLSDLREQRPGTDLEATDAFPEDVLAPLELPVAVFAPQALPAAPNIELSEENAPEKTEALTVLSLPLEAATESDGPENADVDEIAPMRDRPNVGIAVPMRLGTEDAEESMDDSDAPAGHPIAGVALPRKAGPNGPLNIDLPVPAAEVPVVGDSEQPQTDGEPADPNLPRAKPAKQMPDAESKEAAAPSAVSNVAESAIAKDSSAPADAPRIIDAPAPRPATEPKPANLQPPALPPAPPQADDEFVNTNHDRIVSSVRTQLLPNGGSMHIRLDPPELGALQIHVRMIDGVMQASFETSSDQATRLLSHTLSHLKTALETQGVAVDKLQVQQSPREHQANAGRDDQQRQPQHQDSQAQREQQRRELMNRMWRRMRLGRDPLDMVA